jgi:ABC-type sugar transport system ATPase subunit
VSETQPLLVAEDITKYYGGVRALYKASAGFYSGEVVALVGDNAAGKSTFAKILAGALRPTSGKLTFEGREVAFAGPEAAREAGIEMVYQDLALVPDFNAAENLFFGREKRRLGVFLDHAGMRDETERVLARLGIKLASTTTPTRYLSGGQRQSVAIGRAVAWGRKMVILDEPTAALGVQESERVLELITRLRNQGTAVLVISHNMHHVLRVSDRVIVLRHGEKVADMRAEGLTTEEIVRNIVGVEGAVV